MTDDNLIMDPRVTEHLKTNEEAVNYVDEFAKKVSRYMKEMPGPQTARLNAMAYVKWERRMLITYGRGVGALEALQAFGIIYISQFKTLKNKLMGAMLPRTASVQMGVDNK